MSLEAEDEEDFRSVAFEQEGGLVSFLSGEGFAVSGVGCMGF